MVGMMKPVGQRHVTVKDKEGKDLNVDKDVNVFREVFDLHHLDYADTSPVVVPSGYTRNYIDGKIGLEDMESSIKSAFSRLSAQNDFVLVEGTGHCGVGSIIDLDNARVAKLLGLDMVLVANGGLGSAFDELALNKLMCDREGVRVRGVIVNKVRPDKVEQIRSYLGRRLERAGMSLLGVVPYGEGLDRPAMYDYEKLFKTTMISGELHRFSHFRRNELVATGLRRYLEKLASNEFNSTLWVTHASRNDNVLGLLSHARLYEAEFGKPFTGGMILCGERENRPGGGEVQSHIGKAIALQDGRMQGAKAVGLEYLLSGSISISLLCR